MRKLEEKQGDKWVQTRFTRQDKPFVRKADSGGWKAVLPPQSVAAIEAAWGHVMIQLGYELASDTSKNANLVQQENL